MSKNTVRNFLFGLQKQAFVPNPQAMQLQEAFTQIQQFASQFPPEVQQQVAQALQQIQQLEIPKQLEALQQLAEQLQQGQQAAQQQAQQAQQQQAQPQQAAPSDQGLDTKITMTVRELADMLSGGKATKAQLQVQNIVAQQQQKEQQMQQQATVAQEEQIAQQNGMYPTPMGGG